MNNKLLFTFSTLLIAAIAFITGEIATVMMLYLILLALHGIHGTLKNFYEDWKNRNNYPH
ncbi:hypothetical protein [Niallia sp. FSL R7-0271]|uniref:hypothetical protein n=1 Tax=Niallia sp. FSL R7-0271 TaxID=2921678 RepID=UPI0030F54181